MDYRHRQGTPSKQSDRETAGEWRAWIDAALACYANKGGTRGIFVRKGPPPGEPPALDRHNGEGAPLHEMGLTVEEPPRVRIAE